MSDNKNDNDFDDIDFDDFEEDFDVEDDLIDVDPDPSLDSNDDLVDDSLDIEDDPFLEDDLENIDDDGDDWNDEPDTAPKPQKQSFIGKLLVPLILLISFAGGAGWYFYTQILNPSTAAPSPAAYNAPAIDQTANIEPQMQAPEPSVDISVPMPSPISEPVENDFADPIAETVATETKTQEPSGLQNTFDQQNSDSGVLTPMPNIVSTANNNGSESNEISALDTPQENPLDSKSMEKEKTDVIAPDLGIKESVSSNAMTEQQINRTADSTQTLENTAQKEALEAAQMRNQELENQLLSIQNSNNENTQRISSLSSEIETLKRQLQQKDQELIASRSTINELQENIAKKVADSRQEKTAPKITRDEPQSVEKTAEKAVAAPRWELRSAQPGKAFVAIKNSSNVLVVSEGDTLQGIGQIQSISIVDGLWVVRGSQGIITQ